MVAINLSVTVFVLTIICFTAIFGRVSSQDFKSL